jgi:acyl-CoA thioesterase-2
MSAPSERSARDLIEELIHLTPVAEDVWTATPPAYEQIRLFGGHALALCLAAGGRTIADEQPVHSLHAQFLRTAPAGAELQLAVERTRDGRNVSLRRVSLSHGDKTAVVVDVSYHRWADVDDWQAEPSRAREVEGLPAEESALRLSSLLMPFEVIGSHPYERGAPARVHPYWARPKGDLGADPLIHACALAWLSDLAVSVSALGPDTTRRAQLTAMTLEHTLWFHRPPQFADWLQVQVEPVIKGGGRGLAAGRFVAPSGVIGPVFMQDVLLAPPSG